MTPTQRSAADHLLAKARRACDALGSKGHAPDWTLQDVTAVRQLVALVKHRAVKDVA